MRVIFVLVTLAVSPSPAPGLEPLAGEFARDFAEAHECSAVAMEKHAADPLSGFLDTHRAPLVEVVSCDGKIEKLKNGQAARSWAYTHCRMPGPRGSEAPPPGKVSCGADRCCDVENSLRICFDARSRIRRLEYRCPKK